MSLIVHDDLGLAGKLPGAANPHTGGDGYDWQAITERAGWDMHASWGRDGWDLGDWPYVQYGTFANTEEGVFATISYCEGDITIKTFDNEAAMHADLDTAALFHWLHRERDRHLLEGIARRREKDVHDLTVDDLPAHRRGPFSWARLDREKPLTKEQQS